MEVVSANVLTQECSHLGNGRIYVKEIFSRIPPKKLGILKFQNANIDPASKHHTTSLKYPRGNTGIYTKLL